jgi:hypothetical protein
VAVVVVVVVVVVVGTRVRARASAGAFLFMSGDVCSDEVLVLVLVPGVWTSGASI